MLWKQEIELIEDLQKRLTNLGADISRQVTQFESRKTTLSNEIAKLEADYAVLLSRNEDAKKEFSKSRRLDIEQFEESKRRVQQKELSLIAKEKELQKLKSMLEIEVSEAKKTKETIEAVGRNHGRK